MQCRQETGQNLLIVSIILHHTSLTESGLAIKYIYVPSHSNIPGNEEAQKYSSTIQHTNISRQHIYQKNKQ